MVEVGWEFDEDDKLWNTAESLVNPTGWKNNERERPISFIVPPFHASLSDERMGVSWLYPALLKF